MRLIEKHITIKYPRLVWGVDKVKPLKDFIKVTRCKDCKHWEKRGRCKDGDYDYDYGECMAVDQTIDRVLNYVGENHYCGYGERRGNEID